MSWDYAELSKLAKENGGPEALVEKLVQSGIDQGISEGKNSMVPVIGIALALGVGITVGIQKIIEHFSKQKYSLEEIEKAKEEIIQGIKAYDEMNPNEVTKSEAIENNSDGGEHHE